MTNRLIKLQNRQEFKQDRGFYPGKSFIILWGTSGWTLGDMTQN